MCVIRRKAYPEVIGEEAREGRAAPGAFRCLVLQILACSGVHDTASGCLKCR